MTHASNYSSAIIQVDFDDDWENLKYIAQFMNFVFKYIRLTWLELIYYAKISDMILIRYMILRRNAKL